MPRCRERARPDYTIAAVSLAAALLSLAPAGAQAAKLDHPAEVRAFARIMADVRTAAEVCKGLSPDWTVVNEAKERLHLADVDYFAFRKQAADLVDALEQRFRSEGTAGTWCSEAFGLYGPQGAGLASALHR